MARIRSVKPELRTSAIVGSWPIEVRYFWVLFWGYLDDFGRGRDLPKAIAGDCFPSDEAYTAVVVDGWLDLMTQGLNGDKEGPVCRYVVDGERFVHCVHWEEHQRPNRPTRSRLPECPIHEGLNNDATNPQRILSESLTEDATDPHCPDAHASLGAGEQGSRGAGEQGLPTFVGNARTAPKKRGTRIPDDFAPSTDMVAWARSETPNVDGRRETAAFADYWRGIPGSKGIKLDWPATWRNWMRKAETDTHRGGARASPTSRPSTTSQRVAQGLAVVAQLEALETELTGLDQPKLPVAIERRHIA